MKTETFNTLITIILLPFIFPLGLLIFGGVLMGASLVIEVFTGYNPISDTIRPFFKGLK